MSDQAQPLRLHGVGDIMVKREQPETIFELVKPLFSQADIVFGNCESTYSERGARNPATRGEVRAHPSNADALGFAGFNVMSFANNHHLDAGYDAFFDTIAVLEGHQISVCGAGKDLDQARRPAIVERRGTKVAFLGYSSILFPGYAAGQGRPGCTPLRVHTHYEQSEIEQPGCAPKVITFAYSEDLEALCTDVERAKEHADVVVVTPHWGVHFLPTAVADYETQVGRAAIDAGADIVLGHHQHILKGVQVYKGKVIFHGLGNFAMDSDAKEHAWSPALREMQDRYPEYAYGYRAATPTYPFHEDARMTLIAQCDLRGAEIAEVSFIPCYINGMGQPEPLTSADPKFSQVASYVRSASEAIGFETAFKELNDRVLVATAS